jgi:hypothetical protein
MIVTRPPASRAWLARVAMMSSASIALQLQAGEVEGPRGLARQRDLRAQILRHLVAVGLVEG